MKTILFILIPFCVFGQLIDYGFEDYTGDVETSPDYIFTATASTYWSNHVNSTQVVSNCDAKTAYAGTYFLHRQFNTAIEDTCLGAVSESINDHGNVGLNGSYPTTAYGDNTQFRTEVTSDTMVVRYYVRSTGNWGAQGGLGYCKFFRLYGNGGSADDASIITHLTIYAGGRVAIYDPSLVSYGTWVTLPVSIYDGNWHAYAIRMIINNKTNSTGNITTAIWYDDYYLTGSPLLTRTITCPDFGTNFSYFAFAQNWSATYPTALMGMDIDNVQVWDGMPTDEDTDTDPPTAIVALTKVSSTSITYGISNISTDIDTLKVTKVATTLRNKKNVATDWDTTLTGLSSGWHKFTTRMVDDSSNVTVRNDSLKLGIGKTAQMISIIKVD